MFRYRRFSARPTCSHDCFTAPQTAGRRRPPAGRVFQTEYVYSGSVVDGLNLICFDLVISSGTMNRRAVGGAAIALPGKRAQSTATLSTKTDFLENPEALNAST
jgi:hypothetical protein